MRAKKLEVLKCADNASMAPGVNQIIYNLAFSPKIRHIDIKNVRNCNADTAEALYKLISITGALETLILADTGVQNHLSEDFFKSVGSSKTLAYLNLDS